MTAHLGNISSLTANITALGGHLPDELQAVVDAIAAVDAWTPAPAADIASLCQRGELTADTAATILDDALIQPNRKPGDLKVTAKYELTQRFTRLLAGAAGDDMIESIRPAFTTECTAVAAAAELVGPNDRIDILESADDKVIAAWRALAEHRTTLDRVGQLVDELNMSFDGLGGPQPWHGPCWLDAAMYATDVGHLDPLGRALLTPSGTGGPRAGKWHAIASAITLNTLTEARGILAEAEQQHREAEAADYNSRHGTLTDGNGRPRAAAH